MPRAGRLGSVVGAAVVTGLVACARVATEHGAYAGANVLVVVLDTQRADRLGCYGGPPGLTPFLDRLAARGVVFHHAYAAASWTEPSVASVLTSRLPSQHGVTTYTAVLRDEETTLVELLRANGWRTEGFSANSLLQPQRGFAQGYDGWSALPPMPNPRAPDLGPMPVGGEMLRAHAVDWLLDAALDDRTSRTLLWVQYMEPHYKALPDDDLLERIGRERNHRIQVPFEHAFWHDKTLDVDAWRDFYDASVATLDRRLAGLFDDLERLGFLDRAVVVVMADHGQELFDHDLFGHGHTLYEELIHVPLLVVLPGQQTRIDVDDVVSTIDVAPTVLDLLGLPAAAEFEGRSLRETIATADGVAARLRRAVGRPRPGERAAYAELIDHEDQSLKRPTPYWRAILRGDRKLVQRTDGRFDLFDLAHDPEERAARPATDAELAAFHDATEWVASRAAAPAGEASEHPLSPEEVERLRALGYLH